MGKARVIKVKKRCCKSRPRCKRCPVVCKRLTKDGLAEPVGDCRFCFLPELKKRQLAAARAR